MHKQTSILMRLLCFVMVVSLVLGLVACASQTGDGTTTTLQQMESAPSSSTQTTPSSTATQPTTVPTQPTEPTKPTEPEPEPEPRDPIVYELTQEDVDLFYTLLEECETLSLAGEDMEAIEAASEALDAQYEYLNTQYSIANILYYCDCKSSSVKEQYLNCVDICTDAYDAYIQMARRVYQSDSPAKDMLFEGWTEEDIAMLLAYDEKIAELQKRNEEITVEYNAAMKDSVKMELYVEFVQNNNKIASFYGYDNYYDYSYALRYDRDYDPDELHLMRQYAKDYLADIFDVALNNFYSSFYTLKTEDQTGVTNFLYNDYNVSTNYVKLFLDTMPESMADTMNTMLKLDSTFTNSKKAKAGAFTTTIGDRSYCYFGPGYANSCTVIHEAGHYYASRYTDLNSIPLDLAEVHSQGNEWLFVHFMKDYLPSNRYDAVVDYRLYNDLTMIMICLMVDEFEHKVYTTDVSGFTGEDFDALMESVATQYFTMDYISSNLTDVNEYWRMVVVDQPVYYISYAVSSITALDLYTVALEDFDRAVEIYMQLCEQPLEDKGFLEVIHAAELAGPFDENFYQKVYDLISSRNKMA